MSFVDNTWSSRWRALRARLRWYFQRARTRRELRDLDAKQLADIGRSEAQRLRECRKHFWQS